MNDPVTMEQIIKAYADSLDAYYNAESAFVLDPNQLTLGAYHRALDRLTTLRGEVVRSGRLGDALDADRTERLVQDLASKALHQQEEADQAETEPEVAKDPQENLDEGYPKPPPDYPPPPEAPDEPAA